MKFLLFSILFFSFSLLKADDGFTISEFSLQDVSMQTTTLVSSPVIAIDKYGNAVAAFINTTILGGDEQAFITFRPAGETNWQQQQVISNFTGNEVEGIDIAMNPDGKGVVVWEQKDNQIHSAIFQVTNNTFSVVGNINVSGDFRGDIQSAPQVVITNEGTALCVWEDHNTTPWKLAAATLPQGSDKWVAFPKYVSEIGIVQDALEVHLNINNSNQGILSWRTTINGGSGGPVFSRRFSISENSVSFAPILQVSPIGAIDQLHIAQGIDGCGNIFIGWQNQDPPPPSPIKAPESPYSISGAFLGKNASEFTSLGTVSSNTLPGNDASNLDVSINPSGYGGFCYETTLGSVFVTSFKINNESYFPINSNFDLTTETKPFLSDPKLFVDCNNNITLTTSKLPSKGFSKQFGVRADFLKQSFLTFISSFFEKKSPNSFGSITITQLTRELDGISGSAPLAFNNSGQGATVWQKSSNDLPTPGIQGASISVYSPANVLLQTQTSLTPQLGIR